MTSFTIDITGLKELDKMIKKKSKAFEKEIDFIIGEGIMNDALMLAKKLTPVDQNFLRNANSVEKVKPMVYKLSNNMPYAPYVEFGTGGKYVPGEWDEFASQFEKSNYNPGGTFEEGVKAIEDWLKRKGGDPADAKWVFYLILKNGIHPQPFMWPAYKVASKQLIQDITDYVNNFRLDE
jgi:hypothetical protein